VQRKNDPYVAIASRQRQDDACTLAKKLLHLLMSEQVSAVADEPALRDASRKRAANKGGRSV